MITPSIKTMRSLADGLGMPNDWAGSFPDAKALLAGLISRYEAGEIDLDSVTDPELRTQAERVLGRSSLFELRHNIPSSIDDAYMAEAFAIEIEGRYLYVGPWHRWYRWDGRRWAKDVSEAVYEEARQWVTDLGAGAFGGADGGASTDVIKRLASYRNRSRIEAVVTLARRIETIAATPEQFDTHPDLLCVRNGVIDLRTGELTPHDPDLRITMLADTEYHPDAAHADVETVLAAVDDTTRPWLQRVLGYSVTGHTTEDVVPVFDGTGSNGKTSLIEATAAALGDYAAPVSARLIMRTSNDEHPTIKADLRGRRLCWISETEEGGSLRTEQLKALTGGDRIKARFIGGDYFDFQPTHTLIVATNHRPHVATTEFAVWRRLRLVPFPYTFDGSSRDTRLRQRLRFSAQRQALLAWLVAGAVDWHRDGLGECATVDAATAAWRDTEDVMGRFIDDCLCLEPVAEVRGSALYLAYKDWCASEGRPPRSNKNFSTEFLSHDRVVRAGVGKVDRAHVAIYRGVRTLGLGEP